MSEQPANAFRIEIDAKLVRKSVEFTDDGPVTRLEYDDGAVLLVGFPGESVIDVSSPNRNVVVDGESRRVRVSRS